MIFSKLFKSAAQKRQDMGFSGSPKAVEQAWVKARNAGRDDEAADIMSGAYFAFVNDNRPENFQSIVKSGGSLLPYLHMMKPEQFSVIYGEDAKEKLHELLWELSRGVSSGPVGFPVKEMHSRALGAVEFLVKEMGADPAYAHSRALGEAARSLSGEMVKFFLANGATFEAAISDAKARVETHGLSALETLERLKMYQQRFDNEPTPTTIRALRQQVDELTKTVERLRTVVEQSGGQKPPEPSA